MADTGATFADKVRLLGRVARVGVGVIRDRVAPTRTLRADDVPGSVAQITPEWLTAVLCKGQPGAKVQGVKLTGGDSGSSTRQGLELTLNDAARQAGIPQRLFTKSSPTFIQRMFLGLTDAALGEIGFYRQIRPQLDIEAPRGYHACMDRSTWRSMILMDDIAATRGAKFISTETYIDKSKMSDLLGNMARWHAAFWDHAQLRRELAWVRTPAQFLTDMSKFISFKGRALLAMEKYPHLLPANMLGQGESLWNALQASYQINLRMPATFLHGDAHIGQTYITRDGRMGYGDWQLVQRGGWAADFAYGLTSALTIDDRRNWDRDLLRQYLDALHAAGGPKLDFDAAWLSYRQHTLYPFFAWAFTRAGAGAVMPDMQPDSVCNDIMTRTAHAVSDLESIAAVQ